MAARPRRKTCCAAAACLALAGLLPWPHDAFAGQPRTPIRRRSAAHRDQHVVGHRAGNLIEGIPDVAKPGCQHRFYDLAVEAAAHQDKTTFAFLKSIAERARQWIKEDHILDREEFQRALNEAMHAEGQLTLVLGGKSLGKSFAKQKVITNLQHDPDRTVRIVSIDMRATPNLPLFEALAGEAAAEAALLNITWAADFAGAATAVAASTAGYGPVGSWLAQLATKSAKPVVTVAQSFLSSIIRNVTKFGYKIAFVIDEANLALPDRVDPVAAQSALAYIVKLTKQGREASVVLLSSDFGYPYRLQQGGLNLADIGNIIVVGEVPEDDMLKLFTKEWGLSQELAQELYLYYGGSVYLSHMALKVLADQRERFDPFAVLETPGLPSCVKDDAAREHLINICLHGYSYVKDIKADTGAKLIAEENVGGVINRRALTFGLPANLWNNTTCEYAVIASSSLMRLKVCRGLAVWEQEAAAAML